MYWMNTSRIAHVLTQWVSRALMRLEVQESS